MKQLLALSVCLLLVISGVIFYRELSESDLPEVVVTLSDDGITVNGGAETDSVFTSRDIIYYEDREFYDGGSVYGLGTPEDRHSAQEAAAHTVVNITAPGTYRLSGKLSAGQIRIDLGPDAIYDCDAVVNLILDDADITCTVAPAILFLNVYECDTTWKGRPTTTIVDTSRAGANLILEGSNYVSGSHVARIFVEDRPGIKLWKQDGAIFSYMSMNIDGPGSLELTADWEGLCTELHLTVLGGDIVIRAGDDGINCSEDNVSVVNINGGFLHILPGPDGGDGIDSNGFVVMRGGTAVIVGNNIDGPMDGDHGIFIHGGTYIGFGSSNERPDNSSRQLTIYLDFNDKPTVGSSIALTDTEGNVVLAYDPANNEVLDRVAREYKGVIMTSPDLKWDQVYQLWFNGTFEPGDGSGLYREGMVKDADRMFNFAPLLSEVPDGMLLYDNVSDFFGNAPQAKK